MNIEQPLPPASVYKGIYAPNGTVDIHGALYHPTWTRLAATVSGGAAELFVQDWVNWQPGQELVIVTTWVGP